MYNVLKITSRSKRFTPKVIPRYPPISATENGMWNVKTFWKTKLNSNLNFPGEEEFDLSRFLVLVSFSFVLQI